MGIFKRSVSFVDLLSLVMFFTLYFGSVDSDSDSEQDYYRNHPSAIPSFLNVPKNITVHQGELAILKCHVYNLGPKVIVWRLTSDASPLTIGEATFAPDKSISIQYEMIDEMETHWDLWIENVQQNHSGIYECSVSATDIYTLNITLNVLDPIEHDPELSINGSEFVSVRKEITLMCNATGAERAPRRVDWFFKGQIINQMRSQWYGRLRELNRIPIPGRSLISTIIIEKATMEDDGNYVCRMSPKLAKGMKVHILNDYKEPNSKRGVTEKGDALYKMGDNSGNSITGAPSRDKSASYVKGDNSGVSLNNDVGVTWTIILLTCYLGNMN